MLTSALSPRRDRAREGLSAASAARPASSLHQASSSACPCWLVNFRTSRMNSGGVHKGPDTRTRATPEPAERTPNPTPLGSKTAAPHVYPLLLRTPHSLPSPPPQGYQSKHLLAFWFGSWVLFSLQSAPPCPFSTYVPPSPRYCKGWQCHWWLNLLVTRRSRY